LRHFNTLQRNVCSIVIQEGGNTTLAEASITEQEDKMLSKPDLMNEEARQKCKVKHEDSEETKWTL
jgi:hypothetical protein